MHMQFGDTIPGDDGTPPRSKLPGPQFSPQVPGIVLDMVPFQKLTAFRFKGALAMMLLLRGDMLPYRFLHAGADGEHRITLLPLELSLVVGCPDASGLRWPAPGSAIGFGRTEMGIGNGAGCDTQPVGSNAAVDLPVIVFFPAFLALRASNCNGWALSRG